MGVSFQVGIPPLPALNTLDHRTRRLDSMFSGNAIVISASLGARTAPVKEPAVAPEQNVTLFPAR
ncbi:hypothetical protein QNO00_11040 [Arthrobacter sp. zg-Y1219]|uniref:hypothetical protein n=1 Tax=Arthrobacter sp. zg-Y1219 TaxID=3049067 RepID=UPI0024C3C068|nr:hypothetical protein [Arthrobacter sp. zg-Y1219]MDK1360800.1 hypothetical protein [Arthrobacter sp. zg-Y1219]